MSRILIDTDVLLALLRAPEARAVHPRHLATLEEADALFLSAASLFEVNQKIRRRKLSLPTLDARAVRRLEEFGIALVPCDAAAMAEAGALAWLRDGADHCDPFDRMILACARAVRARVMSSDAAFDAAPGVERIAV